MENKNENFMDSRTILAIVLVGLVWFGWQSYLGKKYPQIKTVTSTTLAGDVAGTPPINPQAAPTEPMAVSAKAPELKASDVKEERIEFKNANFEFALSSLGMSLKDFQLSKHVDRSKNPIRLGESSEIGLFQLHLTGSATPIPFVVLQQEPGSFVGTYKGQGFTISQTLKVNDADGTILSTVKVQTDGVAPGLTVFIPEALHEHGSSSFLLPSMEHQEFVVHGSTSNERINITSSTDPLDTKVAASKLTAISSQYFTVAAVNKSDLMPDVRVRATPVDKKILAEISYKPGTAGQGYEFSSLYYLGPKSITQLQKIDAELVGVLSLGFFSGIAKILLNTMLWFEKFVGNWGVAIVLLTLLVRALVLPFNIVSYKSMKRMQQIQPKLTALRERYKDDAQALNREMMKMMKDNKVNPLGGCLPMLLQMPVFFALYQVLGQSVELYQAPFIFWIKDLSLKDPFFVLPALMGVAMYVQQKITPTTMDPAQAKVMQFLPIIFSLMMISLPSGLTLYIFVSTLFGVIQQQIFMRDTQPVNMGSTAKA